MNRAARTKLLIWNLKERFMNKTFLSEGRHRTYEKYLNLFEGCVMRSKVDVIITLYNGVVSHLLCLGL